LSGGAENISLYGYLGSQVHYWINAAPLAAYDTFIFAEKVVLIGGDVLRTDATTTTDVDVSYTYLDQDWS
jgi:hypothetical protein